MKQRIVVAVDLFCGAGGTSTGLANACKRLGYKLKLLAINHWDTAIETHSSNHTAAQHLCVNVESVNPREAVPGGKLDLLIASPECTHHSNARGGKPMSDQSRASAWHVLRWAEHLDVKSILIENVPEFIDWGPLGSNGRPLKKRKGETFLAFIAALKSLGYHVDYRILNAANYGDPTTRRRLFILARKGRKGIVWPEPTHTQKGERTLFGQTKKWRAAREIIDWDSPGESIFSRKKPLSPNTLRRIYAGLQKFGGLPYLVPFFGEYEGKSPRTHSVEDPLPTVTSHGAGGLVQPYLVMLNGTRPGQVKRSVRSVDDPVPTLTGTRHVYLAQPFVLGQQSQGAPRSTEEPLPTITSDGAISLVQPYLLNIRGGNDAYTRGASIDDPVPAITSESPTALVQPFIISLEHSGAHGKQIRSDDEPVPTITGRGQFGVVESFIVPTNHGDDRRTHSLDKPMPTITSVDAWGLVEPFLVEYHGGEDSQRRTRSVDEPLPTQDTSNRFGVVQPYIVKYYSTATAASVDEPLDTITAKERFGLCIPQLNNAVLDIRFRMLTPRELARAMSFPDKYEFAGNREKVVKQIGNAVPVRLAEALCSAMLG